MPSGKKARQKRREATPPPVRSRNGSGLSRFSQRTLVGAGVILVVAIGLGVGLPLAFSSSHTKPHFEPLSTLGKLKSPPPPGKASFEGPPLETGTDLAPAGSPAPGASVDAISCEGSEQLLFHTHARLTIFVDGHERPVPPGIGIADAQTQHTSKGPVVAGGACITWLHTHTSDGVIHIESPIERAYTLGNFFDVWGLPLSQTQVGPASGAVTAIVNGERWVGDPAAIVLTPHAQIQLEVGRPLVAPVHISNWAGL
jgi:hypothetical protein